MEVNCLLDHSHNSITSASRYVILWMKEWKPYERRKLEYLGALMHSHVSSACISIVATDAVMNDVAACLCIASALLVRLHFSSFQYWSSAWVPLLLFFFFVFVFYGVRLFLVSHARFVNIWMRRTNNILSCKQFHYNSHFTGQTCPDNFDLRTQCPPPSSHSHIHALA